MEGINGIVIIVGNYGSGKTEVAINLAVHCRQAGAAVRLADLDLVNPYFRTREARRQLADMGVDVILPPEAYLNADLPILTPTVLGMIRQSDRLTLLDAGGDDVGATVLARLADVLAGKPVQMLQVVNPFRPVTGTTEGCMEIRTRIEAASRLLMTGIVGNAHLMDETTVDHIYDGYAFVHKLSEQSGLPIKFITIPAELTAEVDFKRFSCPVLPLKRQLVPPWKKAQSLVRRMMTG